MDTQTIEKGFERIWKLFEETDRKFQETDRKFQETDRQFKETDRKFQETDRQFKETDRKFQETDRKFDKTEQEFQELRLMMREMSQETDRKFQETDRQIQELSKRIDATSQEVRLTSQQVKRTSDELGRLGNRLGEFVEYLIKPAVVKLFQERGIEVHKVARDIKANNPKLGLATQIDLLVINTDTCILIEIKSHLSVDDINEHVERMEKFKPLFPEYKNSRVLGAVSGMVMSDEVARYGYKKGFFVIGQKGETAVILNDDKFKPTVW
jgi:hypothetical protein